MGFDWSGGQGRKRPPNYLSRPMQRRLFTMMAMLMLLLFAMQHARRPQTWHWLWVATGATPPNADKIALQETTSSPSQHRSPRAARSADLSHDDDTSPIELDDENGDVEGWLPGVDRPQLDGIIDDTYFHRDEHAAWFHLLQVLNQTPSQTLESYSLGRTSYLQLNGQIELYRGRLVDIEGTIRRVERYDAPANTAGIASYWRCWLFPNDGPQLPIVIFLLNAPPDLAEATELEYPVRLTGIVYKRWAFRSVEELTTAPVVLAKNITSQVASVAESQPFRAPMPRNARRWLVAGIAASSIALVWLLYRATETTAKSRRRHSQQPPDQGPDFDQIKQLDSGSHAP